MARSSARALGLGERLGHGLVERHVVDLARRARAARPAARRAPPPRAPRARAVPRPARPPAPRRAPRPRTAPAPRRRECRGGRARRRCRDRSPRRSRAGEGAGVAAAARRAPSNSSRTPFGLVRQTSEYSLDPLDRLRSSPSSGRGSIRIAGVSTTSAPSSRSRAAEAARLRAGARDGHHLAVQRPPLEPGDRLAKLGHRADHGDRRRPDLLRLHPRGYARRACPTIGALARSVPRSTTATGSPGSRPAAVSRSAISGRFLTPM